MINVAVATEVPYVPESCEGSNDIRNNNQLSFARGYEGIALLHYMMGQPRYRNKLRFFYTGLGSNSPRYSKENSRRIVYKIISVNLQP